jgi:hypothetical protein
MEMFYDGYLFARILLTVVTLGYGAATIRADFNKTHATNPLWTPHARFHLVWQVSSYAGFGLLALGLIWAPGPLAAERLYFASLFAAIVYGAFFVARFTMKIYGGSTYDENGYLPLTVKMARRPQFVDLNVAVFTGLSLVLAVTLLVLSQSA